MEVGLTVQGHEEFIRPLYGNGVSILRDFNLIRDSRSLTFGRVSTIIGIAYSGKTTSEITHGHSLTKHGKIYRAEKLKTKTGPPKNKHNDSRAARQI